MAHPAEDTQEAASFCLRPSEYETHVIDLGIIGDQTSSWLTIGDRQIFPYPLHYRVSLVVFGENCTAQVKQADNGDTVFEVKRDRADETFVGTHPTAPFAKLWLKVGRDLPPVSGLKAFGFMNPAVQKLLLQEMQDKCPHLCSHVGTRPSTTFSFLTDGAQAPSPLPAPMSPQTTSSKGGSGGAGLMGDDVKPRERAKRNSRPPLALTQDMVEVHGNGASREPTPGRKQTSAQAADRRHGEKSKRKPVNGVKSMKGFTGFTSFGLEQRAIFKKAYPQAASQLIEKMVGDAWGLLSMEEKEAYKAKAQLQARERRNTLSAVEERAQASHETGRQQRAPTQKQLHKASLMPSGPTPPPFAHDDISDGESLETAMRAGHSLGVSENSMNRSKRPKQERLGLAMHSHSGSVHPVQEGRAQKPAIPCCTTGG
eukprot:jgi/Botrbrau1/1498/Bobra.178_3s0052.2